MNNDDIKRILDLYSDGHWSLDETTEKLNHLFKEDSAFELNEQISFGLKLIQEYKDIINKLKSILLTESEQYLLKYLKNNDYIEDSDDPNDSIELEYIFHRHGVN